MRANIMSKKIVSAIAILIVLIILTVSGWVYTTRLSAGSESTLTLSGTIEATEINVPTISGGRVKQVYVAEGDQIHKGQQLALITSAANTSVSENINSPIDGVVLERLVEPDEFAPAGSTVMVVASLDTLTLEIYVPEDRYGQISLGQTIPVAVDSFPGETFTGKVSYISQQAEFTPRNVQTTESRVTTVYSVKLALAPSGGRLKPGMPADATLSTGL
ncbi:MAG: efflux RND transporter periplasmic adaptor subunit [Chloroflexi bacterium]|nr:efflux RND transporter periplasmic adaptor subunit [Chloroflexota bacterium]